MPGGSPGAPATGGAGGRVLPIRPLTVGDILDGAFRLLRDRFGRIALIVLVVLGPVQLVTAYAASQLLPQPDFSGGDPEAPFTAIEEAIPGMVGLMSVTGLLGFIAHVIVAGALVWLVLQADVSRAPTMSEALAGALRRAWPLLGGTALVGLLALGVGAALVAVVAGLFAVAWPLAILLAVPAFPLLIGLGAAVGSLVIPVAMVETDAGPARCAGRALLLVRRRLGRMLGVTVLVLLVLAVVTMAVSLVFSVASLVAGPVGWVVDGVSGTAISVISTPVTVFAALLLYIDARVRLEGWDLQLRARRQQPW